MDYYDYQSFVISNRDNLVKSTQGELSTQSDNMYFDLHYTCILNSTFT